MKKIIAITLCALIAFGMIAGIASTVEAEPKAEPVTMCIWDYEEVLC